MIDDGLLLGGLSEEEKSFGLDVSRVRELAVTWMDDVQQQTVKL
jgi:hypothetical protein